MAFRDRLSHAWNAFLGPREKDIVESTQYYETSSSSSGYRSDRIRRSLSTERSIISSIYTRIGIDGSSVSINHVKVDKNNRFLEDIPSSFNRCLSIEANIDQAARAFRQDMIMTMLEKGVIAVVPVDTDINPDETGGYDIKTMRIGEITGWFPTKVKVSLYNERTGRREEIILPKKYVAIVENPLYSVMNEPNSTLQRLIRKLNILDAIDEQSGSGKLDILVQLPYTIRTETKKAQAAQRRSDLEDQLANSRYGVGYIDATERVTQLNRASENNLLAQIQYLTDMLYQQLGLTPEVFNGTATEEQMLNYYSRTIEPIVSAISEEFLRKFLTKTAITQGQSVKFAWDVFKLVPLSQIAEIADKFTRNEIATSNEMRSIVGWRPSDSPNADVLMNKNLSQPNASEESSDDQNSKEQKGDLK